MINVSFSERRTVQNPLLKYVIEAGWEYLSQEKALELRDGEAGVFLTDKLKEKLREFNPWIEEETIGDILKDLLERTRFEIIGNQKILNFVRGRIPFYSRLEKRELDVKIIDFENPENNDFQVTDELTFTNGKVWNRFDLVFYINGIPVAIAETKSPENDEWLIEVLTQMRRYHRESPEFMIFPLVYTTSNLLEFRYGCTWNVEERYLYHWHGSTSLATSFEQLTKSFFSKERILSLLSDYIIFWEKRGASEKIILNFHQIRAVEKIIQRVAEAKKKRGLIWHTQGSGKSLTMIVAAHKLWRRQKQTMLMIIDRNELEEQMEKNLKNYGFPLVETAQSKKDLQKLLKSDFRGLILTTIQKFEGMEAKINEQENLVVFVDEAHRSHEGDLGVYLNAALPKAFYFGFTGTPIDKTNVGKGTFQNFGRDDPPQGYLDKYSILDSLRDGTTVPLHYTLSPNELLVPTDLLEKEFFKFIEEEAVTSVDELDKRVLEKAARLKNLLKSDERVRKVASFVANHYKENVEPLGFKAFLVGVDREACALLKTQLDKYLPQNYSKVIYTPGYNDPEFMKKHFLSEEEERNVKQNFLNPKELPKILIITSKLLTGFDAPILYAMYLDKPMSDHTLLQAIARVNRPLEEKEVNNPKTSGLIIDFVGIFEKLEKALRFDSANIEGVMVNLEKLKEEFAQLMASGEVYLSLVGGKIDDKAVERVIDYFIDKERRREFAKFYTELEGHYETLAPDPFLRPYLENYFLLSSIFKILKAHFITKPKLHEGLLRKTLCLIKEKTKTFGMETTLPLYPINERTIQIIHEDSSPERVKIIKTHRSIKILIDTEAPKQPFLFSLKERLEKILQDFEARQIDAKEALKRLEGMVEEIKIAKGEKDKIGLDEKQFGLYWILQNSIPDRQKNKDVVIKLDGFLKEYSDWMFNKETERTLKRKMLAILLPNFEKSEESLYQMEQVLNLERQIHQSQKVDFEIES